MTSLFKNLVLLMAIQLLIVFSAEASIPKPKNDALQLNAVAEIGEYLNFLNTNYEADVRLAEDVSLRLNANQVLSELEQLESVLRKESRVSPANFVTLACAPELGCGGGKGGCGRLCHSDQQLDDSMFARER